MFALPNTESCFSGSSSSPSSSSPSPSPFPPPLPLPLFLLLVRFPYHSYIKNLTLMTVKARSSVSVSNFTTERSNRISCKKHWIGNVRSHHLCTPWEGLPSFRSLGSMHFNVHFRAVCKILFTSENSSVMALSL